MIAYSNSGRSRYVVSSYLILLPLHITNTVSDPSFLPSFPAPLPKHLPHLYLACLWTAAAAYCCFASCPTKTAIIVTILPPSLRPSLLDPLLACMYNAPAIIPAGGAMVASASCQFLVSLLRTRRSLPSFLRSFRLSAYLSICPYLLTCCKPRPRQGDSWFV